MNLYKGCVFMLNVNFDLKTIKDKILACWIGKNIGGTIGGPYECTKEFLDVKGFTSEKGEPLPNDDLDLQLAWLMALERNGAKTFDANILATAWLNYIVPNWNEYGVGKKNLKMGLLPPLSGELENDKWKHSNGAWIRSELWACLVPGFPNLAVKYAIMDASIDHGMGEGLYAEIYTAALESMAFFETNIRKIIEKALTFIPESTRMAQCINLVLREYDKKTPYREVRDMLIESTKDLGWFQAPANVGFVTIGLMYGEGDFKKSMLYAVNCGDDTDCTGGTVGAIMGIIGGTKGIPADWYEYIGDRIMQICINNHYRREIPKTCTEFTERILKIQPELLRENDVIVTYSDTSDYNAEEAVKICDGYAENYCNRSRFSFDICDYRNLKATVEYEKAPVIKSGEDFNVNIKFDYFGTDAEVLQCEIKTILPEGWTTDCRKNFYVVRDCDLYTTKEQNISGEKQRELSFTITANDNIQPQNKVYLLLTEERFTVPFVIPIMLIG